MSDRSTDSSAPDSSASADGADSGDDLEPGGGPQRVVSDQSVDDILDSLDDSGPDSSSSIATIESEAGDPDEREREPTRANATTETESQAETDDLPSETPEDENSAAETAAADEASGGTTDTDGQGGGSDTDKRGGESDTETGSSSAVDDAAASLPSEASAESLEDLEARVERGTVTGADVRAAEAGDDRDATPEIDEIELSVDDLETPESTIGDGPSDAGPLAGSIDGAGGDGESDDTGESDDDESGLLDRLVGLFSR